jgi:hypothetical protein
MATALEEYITEEQRPVVHFFLCVGKRTQRKEFS